MGGWSAGGCSAADAGCVRCCGGRWGVGERQGIGGPVQACAAGASDSLPLLMRTCGLPPASPPLSPHPFPTSQAGAGTSTSGGSCCFPPCYFRASCRWWPSTSSAPACCARCPTETRWACGRVGACWEGAVRGRRWREGGTAGCCDAPYRLHPELSEASPFVLAPPAQPRNRLDIFLPRKHWRREGPRPTVVFVTGGAWTIGYKAWGALLARRLSQRGVLVFCLDYRNFPQVGAVGALVRPPWGALRVSHVGGRPGNGCTSRARQCCCCCPQTNPVPHHPPAHPPPPPLPPPRPTRMPTPWCLHHHSPAAHPLRPPHHHSHAGQRAGHAGGRQRRHRLGAAARGRLWRRRRPRGPSGGPVGGGAAGGAGAHRAGVGVWLEGWAGRGGETPMQGEDEGDATVGLPVVVW